MISGSISALLKRVVSTALGTIMIFGSASGMACHPGGSLLKSRLGGGASTSRVRARFSAVTGTAVGIFGVHLARQASLLDPIVAWRSEL
jgi:hypothetical protein